MNVSHVFGSMRHCVSWGDQIYLGMDDPKFGMKHNGGNGKYQNCCIKNATLHCSIDRWYMCFSISSLLVKGNTTKSD